MIELFWKILLAPYHNLEMVWITVPLVFTLFLMQLYFGRYSKEEMGWNTAVGNSLVLLFVSIDLFRFIFNRGEFGVLNYIINPTHTFISLVVFLGGVWLLLADFIHFLPKKLAFLISSSLPINFIAYLAIVVVYNNMKLSYDLLWAALMLFGILFVFFKAIQGIEWFLFRRGRD